MTWKERRTVTILTTILMILAAMLLIVLGIRYRQHRAETEDGGVGDPAGTESPAVSDSIYTALRYSNGSTTLSFSRDETGVWRWDANEEFPLDDTVLLEILDELANWKPQQTLTDQESLDASGLAESTGSLSATARDGATTLLFGRATTDGESCYVRLNGDESTVYIIDDAIQDLMNVPIYDMCRPPELPALTASRISSITVQGPAPAATEETPSPAPPSVTLTAQQGSTTVWRCNGVNVTESQEVSELVKDAVSLKVGKCIDYDPSEEAAEICGFGNPPAALQITFASDSQEEQTLLLTVGFPLPDGSGRYARLNGEAPIYLLETDFTEPLMQIAANGLAEP